MIEAFIYAAGIAVVLGIFWAGYELHQIRQGLDYLRVTDITERLVSQAKGPQLFDQEQP